MEIKLNIPIKAVPHQSVRVTRFGRTYQPKKIADYKEHLRRAIGDQIPDGFVAFKADSEIAITMLHYVFEYPKSFPKKKRDKREDEEKRRTKRETNRENKDERRGEYANNILPPRTLALDKIHG